MIPYGLPLIYSTVTYDTAPSLRLFLFLSPPPMLKRYPKIFVCGEMILCFVFLTPLLSPDEPKEVKKPDLIEMQLKVTDRRTGSAIDNADVRVNWGQRESDASSATTNSKGIAS